MTTNNRVTLHESDSDPRSGSGFVDLIMMLTVLLISFVDDGFVRRGITHISRRTPHIVQVPTRP